MNVMDVVAMQIRTKFVQLGLRMILFLHLTSYMWPQDTPLSEVSACYDYIIVGCGTAGAILAHRLSASGRYQVLVIEAGGDPPVESLYPSTSAYLVNSQYDWNFTTLTDGYTGQGHRQRHLELTSGKMLGGDSSLGHMLYIRGDPHDYNQWHKYAKDTTWSYENMLPYFKKTEKLEDKQIFNSPYQKYHGFNGKMGVTRQLNAINKKYLHAFNETGNNILIDGNGEDTLGYYEPMYMVQDGIRQSTAYSFLTSLKRNRHLHVLKETEVIEINFDGNTATGVTAVKDGRKFKVKAKREVIVAAGTIKSPQLLMLSGIGNADHLESNGIPVKVNLPVGKYYQDHLGVILVHKLNIKNQKFYPADPHEVPLPTVIGNVAVDKSKSYPEYQTLNYMIKSDPDSLLSLCSVTYSFNDEICQSLYNQTRGFETMVSKLVLLHPKSRGHVLLQSKDYRVPPMVLSGFFTHEEDLEAVTNYISDFLRVNQTRVFREYGAELVYPRLKACEGFPHSEYWKCYVLNMMGTTYHYTSTCSMGKVVDGRLRVLKTKGLRVVDASVIPLITSGNTQAAVMAVAEKAADMIMEDAHSLPLNC